MAGKNYLTMEMTVMIQKLLCEKLIEYQRALLFSVESFRNGEDHVGLDALLAGMEYLDDLLEVYLSLGKPEAITDEILSALKNLYDAMQNRDITGMTDILEFEIEPVTKKWLEGYEAI
jgi:hypothetical protein